MTITKGTSGLLTAEEFARLVAMTDEEAIANALDDPDNPPLSEERLRRMVLGRKIRRLRERLGMSQAEFSKAYRISPARLKAAEQARHDVDPILVNYITVIADSPERVLEVIKSLEAA